MAFDFRPDVLEPSKTPGYTADLRNKEGPTLRLTIRQWNFWMPDNAAPAEEKTMWMQTSYDIVQTRRRAGTIPVQRYAPMALCRTMTGMA